MFEDMFYGNITLLISLCLCWIFMAIAVFNLGYTLRYSIEGLNSVYSGIAVFSSFVGITTWFIFACLALDDRKETMTFGVWFMIITAFLELASYCLKRHFVLNFK